MNNDIIKEIFHTSFTTQRHRTRGDCESSDFATLRLLLQDKENAIFYVETIEKKIYRYKNYLYCNKLNLHFSREEEGKWLKKQGKFSIKTATELMLKIREGSRNTYSCAISNEFLLIGRTLYQRYCKVKNLCVNVCGNMLFGNWLSISVEPIHSGKKSTRLTKKNYNKIIVDSTKYYNEKTKKNHNDAGLHIEKIRKFGKDIR